MPSSILIPVAIDHETLVAGKIALARQVLELGGRVTLLTVLENVPAFVQEFVTVKSENHLTDKIMSKLQAVAADAPDIDCAVTTGKAGVKIVEYAAENNNDQIIVAAHHPNAIDYFLGSTASRVSRRAPCDVYIMR